MSFDRKIDQVCPHLVVEEFLMVQGLRNMAIPMRPIASAQSVVVRLNGVTEVPSYGCDIPAQSSGTREGPFTVKSGVNDLIKLKVNNGSWQTVILPEGVRTSTKRVCELLTASISGVQFSQEGNRIKFRTNLSGGDSIVYLHGDSTFLSYAGVKVNREYRGKRTFPGWTLVGKPLESLGDRPTRMIVFDEPLAADTNFVEVNYTTIREECRRCGGIGIENDWSYSTDGNVIEVTNEDLLLQELRKITYSARGSNPFHPWYGTTLLELIGQKIVVGGVLQNRIVADVQTSFTRWQSIKKQQEENLGQLVTDEEYPYQLQRVNVEQSQKDPTVLFVTMEIRNRSYKKLTLVRGLRVPQPEDLLGSTQQESIAKESINYVS